MLIGLDEPFSQNEKEKLKEKGIEFYKKRFVAGQYMTVGYLEFEDIDDCKDKIKILQYALNLLLKIQTNSLY